MSTALNKTKNDINTHPQKMMLLLVDGTPRKHNNYKIFNMINPKPFP